MNRERVDTSIDTQIRCHYCCSRIAQERKAKWLKERPKAQLERTDDDLEAKPVAKPMSDAEILNFALHWNIFRFMQLNRGSIRFM
jgi:DNA-directed RNA polymerase subunit RPC12/RpoP